MFATRTARPFTTRFGTRTVFFVVGFFVTLFILFFAFRAFATPTTTLTKSTETGSTTTTTLTTSTETGSTTTTTLTGRTTWATRGTATTRTAATV